MERREEVLNFIRSKTLMTVSSINAEGRPEAAVVGFGETNEFELVFGTSNTSRKYKNIKTNPNVAVVIGWDGPETVQYEGMARELSGSEAGRLSELYFAKNPNSRQYKDLPDERYIMVTPKWVRYTNLAAKPWDIVELKL